MDVHTEKIRQQPISRSSQTQTSRVVDLQLLKAQRLGIRLLLMGITPETFIGKTNVFHIALWAFWIIFYLGHGTFEFVCAAFFARSLLETVAHFYIGTYVIQLGLQWAYYFVVMIPKIYRNQIILEEFQCVKTLPEYTKNSVQTNLTYLKRVLIPSGIWLGSNTTIHLLGPILEAVVKSIRGETVDQIFLFPQVFKLSMWGQILMYISNGITSTGLWFYCVGSYAFLGVEVVKIKSLCRILHQALANAQDGSYIRGYIRDHVEILKRVKELNKMLGTINTLLLSGGYLEFATQMFVITLFKVNKSYYIAIMVSMGSIFLLVSLQCFMVAEISYSLELISTGPYFSKWFENGKDLSKHVILMTQMAQNTVPQTIWFGSLKVDRATTLDLLRSSYAAYTALMIFQK